MPEVAWRVHTRHAIPDTALPLYGPHVVLMTSAGEKSPPEGCPSRWGPSLSLLRPEGSLAGADGVHPTCCRYVFAAGLAG
jgi:hypothetical protein